MKAIVNGRILLPDREVRGKALLYGETIIGIADPEEMIINMENVGNIRAKINEVLSGLEQEVLNAYLDGRSYQEIAESLGRHVKSIDNALQRVKRKLEKYLEENRA